MDKQIKLNVLMPFGGKGYEDFLKRKFDIEIFNKIPTKNIKINLVLFTGGADVHPKFYGEKIGMHTSINEERDTTELEILDYANSIGIPVLGICRGAQLLCAGNGGRLIQHVTGHAIGGTHNITVPDASASKFNNGDRSYAITSTHHQMLYPFDLHDDDYELIAFSTLFLSNIYLNGENENLSVTKQFLEPEIVFFKRHGLHLAIQGHPEFNHCPKSTVEFCLDLITKKLNLNQFVKNEK